ncbi:stage V sporulation protein AD [Bacillus taeanensis]|uniref:Stage V sporulation protein AD n=1 Tax=Bacillus taeanensis TaxID=273032 RepID=A0A366XXJ0_9BACI|nr:stage V sporulation protein AD [Bacillus taeanensis]RBW70366.1 stage V sporulation protein AD [Bacillus taeanensis]
MKRMGKQTWLFQHVYLNTTGTAVGPKEAEGPLKHTFDMTYLDLYCGESSWELAERRLMNDAVEQCLAKAQMTERDIDFFLAGDLLNQTVTSNYSARSSQIPFIGMFAACSTSMETIAVGSTLIESGFADTVIAATSSHNATAERQFRYPTEYGVQKPKTASFTVTGAGAALLSRRKSDIQITKATIGRVVDWGIKNPLDMGSAMAPAAADTIERHFRDTGLLPSHYDLIVTGDLSGVGSPILKELLLEREVDITNMHQDCGLMIYRPDQGIFAGGSGCGCAAVVTYGHLVKMLKTGKVKRVLVVATGALMSPLMIQQQESIPAIAHGVVLETVGREV